MVTVLIKVGSSHTGKVHVSDIKFQFSVKLRNKGEVNNRVKVVRN